MIADNLFYMDGDGLMYILYISKEEDGEALSLLYLPLCIYRE